MTRRERHVRIVKNMGTARANYMIAQMMAQSGSKRLQIFTDAAIEELARKLVNDVRLSNRINAENRARRAAQ